MVEKSGVAPEKISTQEVFHGGSGFGSIFKQDNQLFCYAEGNPQRLGSDLLRNLWIGTVWHSGLLLFHLRDPLTRIEFATLSARASVTLLGLCLRRPRWREEAN